MSACLLSSSVRRAMLCTLLLVCATPFARAESSAEVIEPTDPGPAPAPATPTPKTTDAATPPAPAQNSDTPPAPTPAPAPVQTTPTLEPPRTNQPVARMPITVNEPDFKATAVFPVTPEPKIDQDTRAPKEEEIQRPRHREFSVPQEEGVAEPPEKPDDKADAAKKEEELSPALAKVIAKERNGKKLRDLLPMYQEVVKAEPDNAEAHYRLAVVLNKMGDLKSALTELENALKLKPSSNKYRCDYGLLALQAGWVEKAVAYCREAAQSAPAVARYQSALGDALVGAGDLNNAVDAYTRASNLDPKNAEYLHNLGKTYLLGRAYRQAGETVDEAIRLRPDYAPYYCTRGLVFQSQKAVKDAIRAYMIAIKLDKDNAYAHYLLAGCYSDPDDPTYTNRFEAFDHAEKAVKLTEGKNAQYLMGLARVLRLQRNYDAAIATARHALDIEPREEWRQELAEFERLKNEGHIK